MSPRQKLALAVMGILIGSAYYSYLTDFLTPVLLTRLLGQWHRFSHVMVLGLHLVRPLTFLPTSLLVLLAGLYFDFWTGLVVSAVGGMLGMSFAYFLGRALGHEWVQRKYPRKQHLIQSLAPSGWPFLAMVRMVPLFPADVVSFSCGACGIPFKMYFAGSSLGSLPGLIFVLTLGAGFRNGLLTLLIPMGLGVALLSYLAWRNVRLKLEE